MCMKRTLALREEHTLELQAYRWCLREAFVLSVAEISEQVGLLRK